MPNRTFRFCFLEIPASVYGGVQVPLVGDSADFLEHFRLHHIGSLCCLLLL